MKWPLDEARRSASGERGQHCGPAASSPYLHGGPNRVKPQGLIHQDARSRQHTRFGGAAAAVTVYGEFRRSAAIAPEPGSEPPCNRLLGAGRRCRAFPAVCLPRQQSPEGIVRS